MGTPWLYTTVAPPDCPATKARAYHFEKKEIQRREKNYHSNNNQWRNQEKKEKNLIVPGIIITIKSQNSKH